MREHTHEGREPTVLKEFRDFVMRGNVVELAVAVIIGAAFGAVITAFTSAFITPLIALIGGKPDFGDLAFSISGTRFPYGLFLNALISFLIIAFVVFFFVVKPINALMSLSQRRESPDPSTRKCPECRSEIPIDARRCAFCTSEVIV
jgi:large conductance mechanosensitive channel